MVCSTGGSSRPTSGRGCASAPGGLAPYILHPRCDALRRLRAAAARGAQPRRPTAAQPPPRRRRGAPPTPGPGRLPLVFYRSSSHWRLFTSIRLHAAATHGSAAGKCERRGVAALQGACSSREGRMAWAHRGWGPRIWCGAVRRSTPRPGPQIRRGDDAAHGGRCRGSGMARTLEDAPRPGLAAESFHHQHCNGHGGRPCRSPVCCSDVMSTPIKSWTLKLIQDVPLKGFITNLADLQRGRPCWSPGWSCKFNQLRRYVDIEVVAVNDPFMLSTW